MRDPLAPPPIPRVPGFEMSDEEIDAVVDEEMADPDSGYNAGRPRQTGPNLFLVLGLIMLAALVVIIAFAVFAAKRGA